MATISFIIFLLFGYFLSNILNADSRVKTWLYSILFPLIMLTLIVVLFGRGSSYVMGQITGECLISTFATIILMFIRLNKKLNKV